MPLLGHHTSGVRKEFYRSEEDLAEHAKHDPLPKLKKRLLHLGVEENDLSEIEEIVKDAVAQQFESARSAPEPDPTKVEEHIFSPAYYYRRKGEKLSQEKKKL